MQSIFMLKCKCGWYKKSGGTSEELKGLREFKPCATCHGPKKFKCPKCANIIKMVRYNSPD